jgi:hypothetical protein
MRFERKDIVLGVIGLALALIALLEENTPISILLLSIAVIFICYAILAHENVHIALRTLLCGFFIVGTAALGMYISAQNFEKEMRRLYGTIYPDSSALESPCDRPGAVSLFVGVNTIAITEFPISILSADNDPLIILDRSSDGTIVLRKILLNDVNNNNLVNIDDNNFWITPTIQRLMIPYRNRLVVRDHSGNIAINIAFINSTHLSLSGNFYYSKLHKTYHVDIGKTVVIYTPDGQTIADFADNCFFNHKLNLTEDGAAWMTDTGVSLVLKKK